jgi:hypothetical protein
MNRPVKYVCFDCRKVWRRWPEAGVLAERDGPSDERCADCGRSVVWIGKRFKAPRRANRQQWSKVRLLYSRGARFHSGEAFDCRAKSLGEARRLAKSLPKESLPIP